MPTPIDNLSKDSSYQDIHKAVSACIAIEKDAGRPQKQAIAMCINMAEEKTGKKF